VIPTMPFGMPIQPFIWPQLLSFLFGQAGLRRCCRYRRQESNKLATIAAPPGW
jgi:hypothetical protein